jgi:uncharacterized protein YxjI
MRRRKKQDYTRYKMREKLVSFGDDFWIEDEGGDRVFKVDGKALRVRDTLVIEDRMGNPVCKTQERKLRVKDTMEIQGPDGDNMATLKKAIISPVRDHFSVKVADGPDLKVQGNILDHEYKIGEGRDTVAEVSKKWFRVRDTYGVEIAPDQNDALILAIAVGLDIMTEPTD